MLFLITSFSGESHSSPAAFAAAARPCRIVQELIGGGFSTKHYTSQLVQRADCDRVDMSKERLFADETVQRAHVITVKTPGEDGGVPASLAAADWWFTWHPQHVPVSLLFTSNAMRTLDGVRDLGFARRVEVLYVAEPKVAMTKPEFLAPLATFVNVRKVCEFSQCGDVRWMLSCPHLASVDVIGYNRPTDWNAGEVFPHMPALQELILYEGGVACLSWLPLCTKLAALTLDGCPWLESCDAFATMAELASLKVVFANFKDISGLAYCRKLTKLNVGGHKTLTDASVIGTLRHLRQLNISHTGIKNISWIDGCAALEELSLFCVPLEEGFDALGRLSCLRSLDVHEVHGFPFHWVSSDSRLEEVSLESFGDGTVVAIEHLRNARMLRKLKLLPDDGDDHEWVPDCTMLEELHISCESSATHLLHRLFSLPHLRELRLQIRPGADNAGIGGMIAPSTSGAGVSPLETLCVTAANMQDTDNVPLLLQCIGVCASLKKLTLRCVPLPQDSDASWLAALTSLQELHISDCEGSVMLNAIGTLTELRELSLRDVHHWTGFTGVWACHKLTNLNVRSCNELTELSALRHGVPMHQLATVEVARVPLSDLSFLEKATGLKVLTLCSLPQLTNMTGVALCRGLRELTLQDCTALASLEGLQNCTSLTECHLHKCGQLVNLEALKDLSKLETLALRQLPKVEALALSSTASVRSLVVAKCGALATLDIAHATTHLQDLTVDNCPRVVSLTFLEQCEQLRTLSLSNNKTLATLPHLGQCTCLASIILSTLPSLRDLSPLLQCGASVQRVSVSKCGAVTNLDLLSQLPHLTSLDISSVALPTLSWVADCTSLSYLGLSSCTGTTDYSPIAKLRQLQSLFITACPLQAVDWISHMSSPPIEEFELSKCPDVEVSDPAALPAFVKLR